MSEVNHRSRVGGDLVDLQVQTPAWAGEKLGSNDSNQVGIKLLLKDPQGRSQHHFPWTLVPDPSRLNCEVVLTDV